jgi:uncharacterized protein
VTLTLLALAATTLLAYAVKAATGFGPALVVVSLGSLLVGPVNAVVLAAFLDLASGVGVVWLDRQSRAREAWRGLAVTMAVGAVAGSLLLGVIPTATLTVTVALGVMGFGLWMLLGTLRPTPAMRRAEWSDRGGAAGTGRPAGARPLTRIVEHVVVGGGGVAGGLMGVGGPPVVLYFGSRLPRDRFRAMIVPLLLVAAVFRVATYAITGQVDTHILILLAASLPALPLGLALGNRIFHRWSERSFRVAVALLVTAAGLRLLF